MNSEMYLSLTTQELFLKDEKSIVPDGCLPIDDDAIAFYRENEHFILPFSDFFLGMTDVITLEKIQTRFNEQVSTSVIREWAYRTMTKRRDETPLLLWDGRAITVDEAATIYFSYFAEGRTLVDLQQLIIAAKAYIRSLYP